METTVSMPLEEYQRLKERAMDFNLKYEIERRIEDAELQKYEISCQVTEHEYDKSVSVDIYVSSKADEVRNLKKEVERLKSALNKIKWYQFWK